MILPIVDQKKTLGQLADTFSIDTEGTIEVFKCTSHTYGALLAFQLLMGQLQSRDGTTDKGVAEGS
jgi:hypothetical protein